MNSETALSMTHAVDLIEKTIRLLNSDDHHWQAVLNKSLTDIRNGNRFEQKTALYEFQDYCHSKCLGDRLTPSISIQEWFTHLDQLQHACALAFKRLENDSEATLPH